MTATAHSVRIYALICLETELYVVAHEVACLLPDFHLFGKLETGAETITL